MVADVTVVGAGVIALTAALSIADRGATVRLIGTSRHGEASEAAGGLLAPGIEPELQAIADIALAARDMYPGYVAMLSERSGVPVWLNRAGVLQVALTEREIESLQEQRHPGTDWLDQRALTHLEPALAHGLGAIYTPDDGCVDPLVLLDALRSIVAKHERIVVVTETVCSIKTSDTECEVTTDAEGRYTAPWLVLAAGAWTPLIEDLPTQPPIVPVKGQMVAFGDTPVSHVTFGSGGYLVPKADGRTIAGSTLEETGFAAEVTNEGVTTVRRMAETVCPALARAPLRQSWAGLRPMTPDLLPIISPDPGYPRVIYACGHSRNGILLAPLTGALVADFVAQTSPSYEISRFRAGRF